MNDVDDLTFGLEDEESEGLARKDFLLRSVGAVAGLAGAGYLLKQPSAAFAKALTAQGTNLSVLSFFDTSPASGAVGRAFTEIGTNYHKANPNSTVKYSSAPTATFLLTLETACKAKKLSDVVIELPGNGYAPIFPCLRPITQADMGATYGKLSHWNDTANKSSNYGVPMGSEGIVWYFNKNLLAKAGIKNTATLGTWGGFANACRALRAAGIEPLGIDGATNFTLFWWWGSVMCQFLRTNAASVAVGKGAIKATDPRIAIGLQYLQKSYQEGWWGSGWQSKTWQNVQSDFAAGKVAMIPGIVSGGIMNYTVWDAQLGTGNYGVFAAPVLPEATVKKPSMHWGSLYVFSVSEQSKQSAAALNFIKYAVSAKSQGTILRETGQFPNRSDIPVASITRSRGAAAIYKLVQSIDTVNSPTTNWPHACNALAQKQLSSVLSSGSSSNITNLLQDIAALQPNP
jgi:ABC-type glycerol-3-phosphate transport system substrate-binding protein